MKTEEIVEREKQIKEIITMVNDYQKLYYPFDLTEEEREELLKKDYGDLMNNRNVNRIIQGLKQECIADLLEDDFWGAQRVLEIIEKIIRLDIDK